MDADGDTKNPTVAHSSDSSSDEDIDKAPTRSNSIYPSGEWSRECRRHGGRGIKHGYGPLRYEDDDDDEDEEEEDEVSGIGGPIKNQDSSSVDEAPSLFPSCEWSRVCRRYGGRGISYGSGPLRYEDDDDDDEEEEASGIGGPMKNQETESIIKKTHCHCDNKGGKLKALVVNVDGGDTDATLLQVDEASSSVALGEQSDAAGASDNRGPIKNQETESIINKIRCDLCNVSFSSADELYHHIFILDHKKGASAGDDRVPIKNQETESIINNIRCDLCNVSFSSADELYHHIFILEHNKGASAGDNKGGKALVVNVDGGDTDTTLLQVDEASSSLPLGEQSDAAGAADNRGGKTLAVTTTTTVLQVDQATAGMEIASDDNWKTIGGR